MEKKVIGSFFPYQRELVFNQIRFEDAAEPREFEGVFFLPLK